MYTSNITIYAECDRFPLVIKQKIQVLKYWKKILDSSNDSAIRNAYNNTFEFHKCGQLNWCTFVTDILVEAILGRKWDEQYIRNIEIMKISNLLHEMYIMKTLDDIFNSEKFPKLHTYEKFKQDFRLENHLLHLENRSSDCPYKI